MVTQVVANDSERPVHFSFAPQALSMVPEDLLDHLAGAPRASVAHPDEAVQALAAATLSEVRRIQAAARRLRILTRCRNREFCSRTAGSRRSSGRRGQSGVN
jgi:hypothetical protein